MSLGTIVDVDFLINVICHIFSSHHQGSARWDSIRQGDASRNDNREIPNSLSRLKNGAVTIVIQEMFQCRSTQERFAHVHQSDRLWPKPATPTFGRFCFLSVGRVDVGSVKSRKNLSVPSNSTSANGASIRFWPKKSRRDLFDLGQISLSSPPPTLPSCNGGVEPRRVGPPPGLSHDSLRTPNVHL